MLSDTKGAHKTTSGSSKRPRTDDESTADAHQFSGEVELPKVSLADLLAGKVPLIDVPVASPAPATPAPSAPSPAQPPSKPQPPASPPRAAAPALAALPTALPAAEPSSTGSDGRCLNCGQDLSSLGPLRRERHVKRCGPANRSASGGGAGSAPTAIPID
mmetsp:Transcript_22276/g.66028  ORF Transcript_22276/g.66028 Transcript_22276/m.66028 type:complete len:160 (+) Transcript_22276:108-587(+)